MLKIDGSHGEGGGQILRTAVSLSVLTKTPVEISNIRANRPDPGIKPQHYTAIKLIKDLCNAQTTGLEIGSSKVTFQPGKIKGGEYRFDIGTAGSIVLVCQTCVLSLVNTSERVKIVITGGTDVKWSPSWDYFERVFLPIINNMGLNVRGKLIRRGYYPKGGGEAELTVDPSEKLKPFRYIENIKFSKVKGIVHQAQLPDHVGTRIKHAAIKQLMKNSLIADISLEKVDSPSPGTGITIWTQEKNIILGETGLGERGIPAERIGEDTAIRLLDEIRSGATIDSHALDQIIPYMALANITGSSSCLVGQISSHAETNMWLVSQFFRNKEIFKVEKVKNLYNVRTNKSKIK